MRDGAPGGGEDSAGPVDAPVGPATASARPADGLGEPDDATTGGSAAPAAAFDSASGADAVPAAEGSGPAASSVDPESPVSAPEAMRGPTAFFALERGTATLAASLIGRVGGRWRLLATTALPAGADEGAVRRLLAERVAAADPGFGALAAPRGSTEADEGPGGLPVLAAEGRPAPTMLIVAGSERTRTRASRAAAAAGWRVAAAGSAQRADPLALTTSGTRPGIRAVLAAVNDPPDSDERDLPAELAVVAAGIASRRRDVPLLLAGPIPEEAARATAEHVRIVAVPGPNLGTPQGDALRSALLEERAGPTATRRALVAAAGSLARVLDLRVELLEVGSSGGLRVRAEPIAEASGPVRRETPAGDPGLDGGQASENGTSPGPTEAAAAQHPVRVRSMEVPAAALFTTDDPAVFDRLEGWSTLPLDRARLRDRMAELAVMPWTDVDGEGAILRAIALRAALERLLAETDPIMGTDAPDLAVGAGGAWSALPGPAAAHVMADVLRRPGAVQLATDHARLLAPLGTIEDDGERDAVIADLLDDLLLPLGTIITPKGLRANRPAGRLVLEVAGERSEVDLVAGGIALVDLPPGAQGEVELVFRQNVELGPRGRRFAIAVSGGLAGLVLDLRDVPLRLPERPDRRREVLATWERALWPERDG